jgi:hypothetical protein
VIVLAGDTEALPVESLRQFDIVETSLIEPCEVQPVLRVSKQKSKGSARDSTAGKQG